MNKLSWMVLAIIFSGLCFTISYFYIAHDDDTKLKPEIVVNALPTTATVTWYTSIPQIHAERLANAFGTETGIDVEIIRDSTFIIRERLMSEIGNGTTEADIVTIADIGTFIELKNQGHLMKYVSSPQALEQLPLIETLSQEIGKFTQDSGVKVNFNTSGKRQILPPDIENALLRICQESLTNVRKHARASEVGVKLAFGEGAVRLSIDGNGIGFDPKAPTEGAFGLIGMRERARLLGGTLVVNSEKGKGILIEVTIPVKLEARGG